MLDPGRRRQRRAGAPASPQPSRRPGGPALDADDRLAHTNLSTARFKEYFREVSKIAFPLVGLFVLVAAYVAATIAAAPARISCGVERWSVKTLQDRPLLRPARATTLRYLVTHRPPVHLPVSRLPFERNVFTVAAAVTLVRAEDDGDLHLVLRAGRDQMIAEAPRADCTAQTALRYRRAMALARGLVSVCGRARVTGVAFFDVKHGQTGVAPNAVELHPVLGSHCLKA